MATDSASQISTKPNPGAGNNYALILGISHYGHWEKNSLAAANAKELSHILSDSYGFDARHITRLTDATKKKIDLQFKKYLTKLKTEDNLLIFFTGHSFQNKNGETFWIPTDGEKNNPKTWIKHSEIIDNFLNSKKLTATHVCIITDSFFTNKPLHSSPNPLTIFDLRYEEKLKELADRRSREIIYPDIDGPFSPKKTGLLSSWLLYALKNNPVDFIDMENLFFGPDLLPPDAGTIKPKILRGRLKSDDNGQFTIFRTKKNIIKELTATPQKNGAPGDTFSFVSKTSEPAQTVQIQIGNQTHPMIKQTNMEWTFPWKQKNTGTFSTRAMAFNINGVAGKWKEGPVITVTSTIMIKKEISVAPAMKGTPGRTFIFSAETSEPAQKALIKIKTYTDNMTKITDTKWEYIWKSEKEGEFPIWITPFDRHDNMGKQKRGPTVMIEKIAIANLSVTPNQGQTGDEFTCVAETSAPASNVSIRISDKNEKMTKITDTKWEYIWKSEKKGAFPIWITPFDRHNNMGKQRRGPTVRIEKIAISNLSVTPNQGQTGDEFTCVAETSAPASNVFIKIGDKNEKMTKITDTKWRASWMATKPGKPLIQIVPFDKKGGKGDAYTEKSILITDSPPTIESITILPDSTGTLGETLKIIIKTNKPAARMDISIAGQRQKVKKNTGANWECAWTSLKKGTFKAIAIPYDKNNVRGKLMTTDITIRETPKVTSMSSIVNEATVTFNGVVNMAVSSVALFIENEGGKVDRHEMKHKGDSWFKIISLKKEGDYFFYMIAKAKDGKNGPPSKKEKIMIARWKDNGDGTVTDIITQKIRNQFEDRGDDSVFDYSNNIIWELYPKTLPADYKDAVGYCSDLGQNHNFRWRLPTKKEWLTFVGQKHNSPTPPSAPFKNPSTQFDYWSQTEYNPSSMYTMNLYINKIGRQKKQERIFVWCVRNPD